MWWFLGFFSRFTLLCLAFPHSFLWLSNIPYGLPGGSDSKESVCNAGDLGSIPGLGRYPREGNNYPLQYSGLENSMDRGVWQATVHGVAKSQTWLSDFSLSQYSIYMYIHIHTYIHTHSTSFLSIHLSMIRKMERKQAHYWRSLEIVSLMVRCLKSKITSADFVSGLDEDCSKASRLG